MFGALVHSQGILGPGDDFYICGISSRPWSCNDICLECSLALCNLNPFLDLEIFPQTSQEWAMLLSM